jgi:hypothetical protein
VGQLALTAIVICGAGLLNQDAATGRLTMTSSAIDGLISSVMHLGALHSLRFVLFNQRQRDKAPVDTPRRAMGHLLGHAVRFGPASDVMAAGEGIETTLSLRCAIPSMAMVAALSAAHLAAILFPATLRRLYIVRDDDPAGDGAVKRLIDRAQMVAIEAVAPSPQLGDFNEDLRHIDINTMRAALRIQLVPRDLARFLGTSIRIRMGDEVGTPP